MVLLTIIINLIVECELKMKGSDRLFDVLIFF
jgi:hypothetical protein